ncbi:MAG: Ycf48-like protein [Firmicutes bacterium ADurb.Bin419]|nr:MAG: Ycf48-like protein [Firmicutes bacterium ADurb.Bin419]
MRKIILGIIFVLAILLLFPSCNYIQTNSDLKKEQNTLNNTKQNSDSEPSQKSPSFLFIRMIEEAGWAFDNDRLFYTSDGGEYWDDITPDMDELDETSLEAHFYDENTGCIVAQDNGLTVENHDAKSTTIFFTNSRGEKWEKSVIPSYYLGTDMSFIDSEKAWILLFQDSSLGIQKAELYKTENEGKSWVKVSDTEKEDGLHLGGNKEGISFINENEGFVVSNRNIGTPDISRTDDGGKTWRDGLDLSEEPGMDSSAQALKPVFFNKKDGIIPVSLNKSQTGNFDNIFYYTHDGGKNWEKSMPIQSKERIGQLDYFFINLQVGWVITHEGILYQTKNGGANWIKIWESTGYENIWCLNFVSDQIGWALADNKIIKTVNGGRSWKEVNSKINTLEQ